MTRKATLRLVTSAVAALCITATQVELSAFRQEPARDAPPVKVSVKIPTTFNLPVTQPAIRWTETRSAAATPGGSGGSKKKWIWIAAAAGGGTAAIFLLRKKDVPVITVGPPTIGGLQIGVR